MILVPRRGTSPKATLTLVNYAFYAECAPATLVDFAADADALLRLAKQSPLGAPGLRAALGWSDRAREVLGHGQATVGSLPGSMIACWVRANFGCLAFVVECPEPEDRWASWLEEQRRAYRLNARNAGGNATAVLLDLDPFPRGARSWRRERERVLRAAGLDPSLSSRPDLPDGGLVLDRVGDVWVVIAPVADIQASELLFHMQEGHLPAVLLGDFGVRHETKYVREIAYLVEEAAQTGARAGELASQWIGECKSRLDAARSSAELARSIMTSSVVATWLKAVDEQVTLAEQDVSRLQSVVTQFEAARDGTRGIADVLVVTALKEEYDEARKVNEGAVDDWVVDRRLVGFEIAYRTYRAADGETLRFALTWATRMRATATAAAAGRVIDKLGVRCLAMSGVCAGRRGKVSPGDVIVGSLLYTYDAGSARTEYDQDGKSHTRFQADPNPFPLNERLLHRAQAFRVVGDWLAERPATLEAQGDWLLARLHAGDDPAAHPECGQRCPAWRSTVERLRKLGYVSARSQVRLTKSGSAYVKALLTLNRGQLPDAPSWRLHVAPIATGSDVMRDPKLFERLSDSMRDVLGVEMEAAAIGEIAHSRQLLWVVMKGVMDHADHDKDDGLKPFAARASAECLIRFLCENLPSTRNSG